MTTITDQQISTMGNALRDFGYPSVTDESVREKTEALLKGDKASDVISMFIRDWLRDANLLGGTP